jgi:hypothetical protein
MASYCTSAKLTGALPSSLPTSMDATFLATQITDASGEVDELAGAGFPLAYESNAQKFPNITDSPATPKTIEQCALWLALSRCYERLEVENYGTDDETTPRSIYFRNKAEAKLAMVRSGEIELKVTARAAGIELADRYVDGTAEADKDWLNKRSEMDTLLP